MTLARRHYQRVTAAAASAATDPGAPINANAYELVLVNLIEDRRRLKQVQSIERKIDIKRQMLPQYAPWIDGVLEAGRGGQDAVLMTIMVWRIDTGDYAGALQIAAYALQYNLAMPDQYKRDVATLVAEEITDQALTLFASGGTFDAAVLSRTEELTAGRDMPDEVRAKLHKALGLAIAATMDDAQYPAAVADVAVDHLRRALALHERVGVKKDIERLERYIRKNPDQHVDAPALTDAAVDPAHSAVAPGASGDAIAADPDAPAPETTR